MTPPPETLHERHVERIRRFVTRGLHVETHSFIVKHAHQLVDWAHGRIDVTIHGDGTVSIAIPLPDVEAMESMAARVRPLILHNEVANFSNVLESVGYLVRDLPKDEYLRIAHQTLKKAWKARRPEAGRKLAYEVWVDDLGAITDVDLALAWLYADLIHQDLDAHMRALKVDQRGRYQAGVLVLCSVAYHVKAAMNLVRMIADRGLIDLDIPPQPPTPPLP